MLISVLPSDGAGTVLKLSRKRQVLEASQGEAEHIVIAISIETVQGISSITTEYTVNGRYEEHASALLNGGENISAQELGLISFFRLRMWSNDRSHTLLRLTGSFETSGLDKISHWRVHPTSGGEGQAAKHPDVRNADGGILYYLSFYSRKLSVGEIEQKFLSGAHQVSDSSAALISLLGLCDTSFLNIYFHALVCMHKIDTFFVKTF